MKPWGTVNDDISIRVVGVVVNEKELDPVSPKVLYPIHICLILVSNVIVPDDVIVPPWIQSLVAIDVTLTAPVATKLVTAQLSPFVTDAALCTYLKYTPE